MVEGPRLSLRGAVTLLNEAYFSHDPETARRLHGRHWRDYTLGKHASVADFEADPEKSQLLLATLDRALNTLNTREADFLSRRFGGDEVLTFEQMGTLMERSPGTMANTSARALRKLRHPSRRKFGDLGFSLQPYLLILEVQQP